MSLFFPHPSQFSFFLFFLGCLLEEFWRCFEDRDPQMGTFGLSGCRVKPRGLQGRQGFTTTRELQTCTCQGPDLRDLQERKKERKLWQESF